MIRVAGLERIPTEARGAAIALGNFDGVHLGHQAVLAAARDMGQGRGAPLAAAVFSPHPRRYFQPDAAPFRLMTDETRAQTLAECGAAVVFELPFDDAMRERSAEAFVSEVLIDALGASAVAAGFDFRFGRDRAGDAEALRGLGEAAGIAVRVVDAVDEAGAKCSSSAIRDALAQGDPATAARMLGRPWAIEGEVEQGDQRGRTLGFPTANVALGDLVRPRFGVYAVEARLDGEHMWRPGVANIGVRPTFDGEQPRVEAHLFDFDGDIYGRRIAIALRAFLRPERRFDGLDALTTQIAADLEAARAALVS